jgi:hypothetical protein
VENSTLIISESFGGRLTAFDIGADGGLSNRRVWADNLGPDGICLDADGAVWSQAADTRTHTGRADSAEGACVRVEEGGAVLRSSTSRRGCRKVFLLTRPRPAVHRRSHRLIERQGHSCSNRIVACIDVPLAVGSQSDLVSNGLRNDSA